MCVSYAWQALTLVALLIQGLTMSSHEYSAPVPLASDAGGAAFGQDVPIFYSTQVCHRTWRNGRVAGRDGRLTLMCPPSARVWRQASISQ